MLSLFKSRVFAAALSTIAAIAAPSFAFAQSGSSSITGTLEVIVKDDFDRDRSGSFNPGRHRRAYRRIL